ASKEFIVVLINLVFIVSVSLFLGFSCFGLLLAPHGVTSSRSPVYRTETSPRLRGKVQKNLRTADCPNVTDRFLIERKQANVFRNQLDRNSPLLRYLVLKTKR